MIKVSKYNYFILCLALSMFMVGNLHKVKTPASQMNMQTGVLPLSIQKVIAGNFLGSAADYNILQVFSLYGSIEQTEHNHQLWEYLKNRLYAASREDPYFKDTYRITSGLLAAQKGYEQAAVDLLSHGGEFRTWDWESLFLAGFFAYEFLDNQKLAKKLLEKSTQRPNAPSMAVGLVAKIIQENKGSEASIRFLEQMKLTLPKQYQHELDYRIKLMKKGRMKPK